MPHKNSFITVTDQFCGAGGSSQGVRRFAERNNGGIEIKLALNHWQLAIDTHNTNFPDTYHECTDISACDPRRYPSTDILITSPECTTHSPAGGNNHKTLKKQMDLFSTQKIDPATERSRATMWDVCRFAEYHNYNCIIVENVVEAKTRWVLFDEWLMCMHKLGYNHKCVYMNSMHCHPTPQSRDRMYIVFWKKGNKAPQLDQTPIAYCSTCETNINAIQTWKHPLKQFGKYRQQYVYCCPTCTKIVEPYYYASFNCIDWSDIGTKISDRKKSLSINTVNRIRHGLNKYGKHPLIITTKYHGEAKEFSSRTTIDALRTQPSEQAHGLFTPFLVNTLNGKNDQTGTKSVFDRTFTQTSFNGQLIINPFVIQLDHSKSKGMSKHINETLPTQTKCEAMALVNSPFIINHNHSSDSDDIKKAIGTQMASDRYSLLCPPFITISRGQSLSKSAFDAIPTQSQMINTGVVTDASWNSFLAYNYTTPGTQTSHITETTDGVNCRERISIINYKEPQLEDCYYRMLKPLEIKSAMAFDSSYIILGSGKDQVKQLGNAVTPPAMEWLIQQCVESLS